MVVLWSAITTGRKEGRMKVVVMVPVEQVSDLKSHNVESLLGAGWWWCLGQKFCTAGNDELMCCRVHLIQFNVFNGID